MSDARPSEPAAGVVFRDVICNLLFPLLLIVILLLAYLNPIAKALTDPPGALLISVSWPAKLNADLDLWVEGPGSGPVGYSRQNSPIFNLLRDDLGAQLDPTDANYEVAIARAAPAGEYVVNLHLYADRLAERPFDSRVEIILQRGGELVRLLEKRVRITEVNRELTVARFRLDESGALVPGSLHDLPKKLRVDN